MNASLALPIQDRSQAGEARRAVALWAQGRGWSEEMLGRIALIVTELANNLALHTNGGGMLVIRNLSHGSDNGVEILSLDSGPGVANFQECLRDGYSTSGTSGTGLGAVKRASQVFAVHSQLGMGTALLSEVWAHPRQAAEKSRWDCGAVNVAMEQADISGDSWGEDHRQADRVRIILADGLGHGELAAQASTRAVETFDKNAHLDLPLLMEVINDALRSTRGAAVSVAELDAVKGVVNYVGIGNVAASLISREATTSLVSLNGIVGGAWRGCRQFSYPLSRGTTLLMASDGLKPQWQPTRYAGLMERPPALIAGVFYRDYARRNDDATALAIRADH